VTPTLVTPLITTSNKLFTHFITNHHRRQFVRPPANKPASTVALQLMSRM